MSRYDNLDDHWCSVDRQILFIKILNFGIIFRQGKQNYDRNDFE